MARSSWWASCFVMERGGGGFKDGRREVAREANEATVRIFLYSSATAE